MKILKKIITAAVFSFALCTNVFGGTLADVEITAIHLASDTGNSAQFNVHLDPATVVVPPDWDCIPWDYSIVMVVYNPDSTDAAVIKSKDYYKMLWTQLNTAFVAGKKVTLTVGAASGGWAICHLMGVMMLDDPVTP